MAWGSGRGSDKAVSPHGLDVPFTTIKSSCHYAILQDEMEAGGAGATARGSDAQIAGVQSGRPGQIQEIGSASCRERVCTYVSHSVGAVLLKKNTNSIISPSNIPKTLSSATLQ